MHDASSTGWTTTLAPVTRHGYVPSANGLPACSSSEPPCSPHIQIGATVEPTQEHHLYSQADRRRAADLAPIGPGPDAPQATASTSIFQAGLARPPMISVCAGLRSPNDSCRPVRLAAMSAAFGRMVTNLTTLSSVISAARS